MEVCKTDYKAICDYLAYAGEVLRSHESTKVQNRARMMRNLSRKLTNKIKKL